MGPELFERWKKTDTDALSRQAETVWAEVEKKYPSVAYKQSTLGKLAAGELYELRHLAIGKTAPDIEGEDLDGKKFKLSDYRGKVVLLVYWGTWCPHCMAMVPHERELVKRYADQPFVLVGVNSDVDRDEIKPVLQKKGITWRSFWDRSEAIAKSWNIRGWPTVYVLDRDGVIRYKQMRDEVLDITLERLMSDVKKSK
jgi:peroxiredoxin